MLDVVRRDLVERDILGVAEISPVAGLRALRCGDVPAVAAMGRYGHHAYRTDEEQYEVPGGIRSQHEAPPGALTEIGRAHRHRLALEPMGQVDEDGRFRDGQTHRWRSLPPDRPIGRGHDRDPSAQECRRHVGTTPETARISS